MESLLQIATEGSPVLVSCIPMFVFVYLIAYYRLFSGWKQKARFEAASCSMSMIHGTVTTILSALEFFRNPWKLDAPNTPIQNVVMEFSMAYFLVDLLHYILFVPEDVKFILHHLATSIYMMSCRYYTKHGALSVMALMGLGEVTTPLQSIWTVARLGRDDSYLAKRIYESTSLLFTIFFTITRGITAPILAWKLFEFYLSNQAKDVIPFWLAASWMAMVSVGLAGSIMWVYSLWVGLRRFNARKKVAAAKISKSQ